MGEEGDGLEEEEDGLRMKATATPSDIERRRRDRREDGKEGEDGEDGEEGLSEDDRPGFMADIMSIFAVSLTDFFLLCLFPLLLVPTPALGGRSSVSMSAKFAMSSHLMLAEL